jgi:hypothetical protein
VQITTNEVFARRRGLVGTLGTIVGFVVLGAGMFISIQQSSQPNASVTWVAIIPWFTLGIGMLALNVGKHYAMRYGGRPRVDQAIVQALKGLDNKNHLYNFVPGLPTEHLLVTPNRVVVLAARPFFGEVIHQGRKWTRPVTASGVLQRLTDGGLGNPTLEAEHETTAVQELLEARLGADVAKQIAVMPLIVLTNPRVKLQVSEPEIPVAKLSELKEALRRLKETPRLPPDLQRRLVRALQWSPQSESEAVSSSRSNTWQRTQK